MTSGRRVALGFLLLFAIAALPVLMAGLPPLFDYPNHLARMHVLVAAGGGGPLDTYYQLNWDGQPDLAMDLIVPLLMRVMPLEAAGQIFILLVFALLAGGTLWLHRIVHRTWSYWPLAGFLFLYCRVLLWGFLNYLFGVGLALCGLALWLALARRPAWLRILVSSVLALAVYFSHIAAFGAYALMVAGLEVEPLRVLAVAREWRRLAGRLVVLGIQFVAPVAVFLTHWQTSDSDVLGFARFWRKADLLFSVFDNYHRPFDVLCFLVLVGLLGVLAARRRLGIARVPAGALALLAAAYLLLPSQLLGGSGADHRMPIVLFLLLIAASAPRFDRRASALGVAALLGVMFLARIGAIEQVWSAAAPVYRADRAALDALPIGAKLAVGFSEAAVNSVALPEIHLPTLAVADRDAFLPTLFAYPTQQPILIRPPYDDPDGSMLPADVWGALVTRDGDHMETLKALNGFDFVVLIGRTPFEVAVAGCLEPRYRSPTFQLFAFDRAKPGCAAPS